MNCDFRLAAEALAAGPLASFAFWDYLRPGDIRYAYEGKARLLETNAAVPRAIPDRWRVGADRETIELRPGEARVIPVRIEIPPDAAVGSTSFNVTSIPDQGEPGGITIRVNVES